MLTKARLKFGLFILGLAAAVPVGLVALSLLSRFVASFNEGADPASIFRGHALVVPAVDEARWTRITGAAGKEPSIAQQEEVVAGYFLAWEALSRAHETGDLSDLPTYWAGAAYGQVIEAMENDTRITMEHERHRLQLRYFSSDGSVVAFDDSNFTVVHTINEMTLASRATSSVVMTLDSGFWRIRSLTLHYNP